MPQQIYEIHVTEEHIKKGKRGDCSSCPIALAVLEQVPDITSVSVLYGIRCYCDNIQVGWMDFTKKLDDWVGKFDCNEHVKPFSFLLNLQLCSSGAMNIILDFN